MYTLRRPALALLVLQPQGFEGGGRVAVVEGAQGVGGAGGGGGAQVAGGCLVGDLWGGRGGDLRERERTDDSL